MKRFKYSLENVLHYKEQILDSINCRTWYTSGTDPEKMKQSTGTGEQAVICPG